ncbi:MAG: hypothetical protein R3Y55_03775 [Rikenellaceae bacterium]
MEEYREEFPTGLFWYAGYTYEDFGELEATFGENLPEYCYGTRPEEVTEAEDIKLSGGADTWEVVDTGTVVLLRKKEEEMKVFRVFEFAFAYHEEKIPEAFTEFVKEQIRKVKPGWNFEAAQRCYEEYEGVLTVRTYLYEAENAREAVEDYDSTNQIGNCYDFFSDELMDTEVEIALSEEEGEILFQKLKKLWSGDERTYVVYGTAEVDVRVVVLASSRDEALQKAVDEVSELTSFDGGSAVGVISENAHVQHEGEIRYTEVETGGNEDE